ncbi:DUF4352 domain-containing protein [Nocardia rhizosphaerihabitans]|uniref:DUF4352 domain-containing protein n=1 Tax=Nocardia rhizosphaerihabitans TaxID=1691570 RepID=A0ABQ2KVU6_9NOCA|nr:DUF4352 domain-containing protein [Nocardia rhizosphaerihabitans]GGN94311.1 hypothetical protein GCM10011610_57120 [Nocardia rhizosphaerihabitans]
MNYPPPGNPPPYGYPNYQPRTGAPGKKGVPKWVVVLIIVAVAIVGIGSILDSIGDPKAASAGSAVRDDGIKFEIQNWEQGATKTHDGVFPDTAQGEFIVLKFTATNVSNEPQEYTLGNQLLIDSKGREFEPISSGHTSLNPGFSEDESIAFDVPKGTVPKAIEFKGGFFGSGTRVKLEPK